MNYLLICVFFLKINGPCVDEGGVTMGSNQEGMILLMRDDTGYDKVRNKFTEIKFSYRLLRRLGLNMVDCRKVHQYLIICKELVGQLVIMLKLL